MFYPTRNKFLKTLEKNNALGILFLRIFLGIRLVYGVADNIVSWEKMKEFESFLSQFNFPFPMVSAIVSVYFQFFAGIFIFFGFQIRLASLFMIINFLIAIIMVHKSDSFEGMTPALFMLFCSILFLFQGAGKYSMDSFMMKIKEN